MISGRTLLLYNFSIAAIFLVVALFSAVALEPLVSKPALLPPFDAASHQAVHTEKDIELLRNRAAFYFELARGLKEARYADTSVLFSDLRRFCVALALAFAVGGVLTVLVLRKHSTR